MPGRYFHNLGRKAVSKCAEWLMITVIAGITWTGFIGGQVKPAAHRLYEQGRLLYMENTKQPLPPAKKDSVPDKYIEKNKRYE